MKQIADRQRIKAVFVSGAASGIGKATAILLAQESVEVLCADLNYDGAIQTTKLITEAGGRARALSFDLSSIDSINSVFDHITDNYGALDAVCNIAADTFTSSTLDAAIESIDIDVWDKTMNTNLRGTMWTCRRGLPLLRAAGGGAIVNVSSGSANAGALGYSAYAISKAAIESLTRHLAAQHGKENIRVNAVSPGFVVTDVALKKYPTQMLEMMLSHHLTPRLGTPEDVARSIRYLISDDAQFVTGQVIAVDGGLLSHQPFYADELRGSQ